MFSLASSIESDRRYLLVEDEDDTADMILERVEEAGVMLAGRVATLSEALRTIDQEAVEGLMIHTRHVDADQARVLQLLPHRGIQVVFFTGNDEWYEDDLGDQAPSSFGCAN